HALAFSPDGKRLASGGQDGMVMLWDVASGKELHVCRGHRFPVRDLAFSPDGRTLASGEAGDTRDNGGDREEGEVRLWDAATGQERGRLRTEQTGVRGVAFSPDGTI